MAMMKLQDRVTEHQSGRQSTNSDDDTQNSATVDIINIYAPLLLSMFATVSNLVNIAIFWKLGLKDSLSVGLISLSLSDFLTTFLHTLVSLCYLMNRLFPYSNIDAWQMGFFAFGWMMNATYLISCWLTALISIERCFCVVFPFKVKQMFTRFRSVVVILIIYGINIGLHVPIYVVRGMAWVDTFWQSSGSNTTVTLVRVFTTLSAKKAVRLEMIFDITVSVAFGNLSYVIVIVCTVWMIYELKETSKVRQKSKSTEKDYPRSNLSKRERKLVKVALALAITVSTCALPRIAAVTVQNLAPDVNSRQLNQYSIILWAVAYICTTFGCLVKTFVYLVLTTNFRIMTKQCFQCHQSKFS